MRLFFLLLPWLELLTLIQLGVETSAMTALAWVFASIVLGLFILRRQGQGMFDHLRQAQDGRVLGPELLVDDMAVGLAGLLLIVPGLITDFAALLVMFGPLRRRLARALRRPQAEPYVQRPQQQYHETIEGSYRRVDDE